MIRLGHYRLSRMNYSARQRRVPTTVPLSFQSRSILRSWKWRKNLWVSLPMWGLFLERNLNFARHLHTKKFCKNLNFCRNESHLHNFFFKKKGNLNESSLKTIKSAVLILEKFEGKKRAATPRTKEIGADQMRNAGSSSSRKQ